MRRFSPLLFVLVLALLLPSAALAKAHSVAPAAPSPSRSHALLPSLPSLGAVERATCTIGVRVLTSAGQPLASASVRAYVGDFSSASDTVTTAADGQALVTNTPVTSNGLLDVVTSDGSQEYFVSSQTFADGVIIVAEPGTVAFSSDTQGVGNSMRVEMYGPNSGAISPLTGTSGLVPAMPASIDYAVAYWSEEEAAEWVSTDYAGGTNAPIAVLAGQQSGPQIVINGGSPRSLFIDSPISRSGAPGTKVTCELNNWLAPVTAELSVESLTTTVVMPQLGSFAGNGAVKRTFSFIVPKKARPGDTLQIHSARTDLPVSVLARLDVSDYFQVCTLVGTKTSIAKGASVRLSGIVPTSGSAKKVILYSRTTKATAQPSNWKNPAGWKKVATLTASGKGVYKSGLLKPTKATWYIVRYPADANNFEAFTSVFKVAVH